MAKIKVACFFSGIRCIGVVFPLLSSVYMCYGLLHCIAQYFVFRLYDSALATILNYYRLLDLT